MAYTAIDDPEAYFQVKAYAGTGSSGASFTLDGDTDMQPDLVWVKDRDSGNPHKLFDSVRGVSKSLKTNSADAEVTTEENGYVSAFNSDGFTVTDGSSGDADVNDGSDTYVAWCFKESATAGFDIVAFTGNETARTVSHSLSAVPKMIIAKDREDGALDWFVGHQSYGWTKRTKLSGTQGAANNTVWNDTDPTSSVFSIGSSTNANQNGNGIIAYLFAPKQGFSAMGSYTGNGDADGAFVYTGFKPAMVIQKMSSSDGYSWHIFDNKRDPFNPIDKRLFPDTADAESTSTNIDFVSNGFKFRSTATGYNGSGNTFIYMAFAEAPFVNSNGVPCNAR